MSFGRAWDWEESIAGLFVVIITPVAVAIAILYTTEINEIRLPSELNYSIDRFVSLWNLPLKVYLNLWLVSKQNRMKITAYTIFSDSCDLFPNNHFLFFKINYVPEQLFKILNIRVYSCPVI
uniref:Uncharacterized protein n=1 Tax=Glossina brevipalpis TaxID=37001 RepID=A0A1A9X4P3_9MUSC